MNEALWLAAAAALSLVGMSWLALALPAHWRQVYQEQAPAGAGLRLRLLATLALIASVLSCLAADHPSMAFLVWIMLAAASAFAVGMALGNRPALLKGVVPRSMVRRPSGTVES